MQFTPSFSSFLFRTIDSLFALIFLSLFWALGGTDMALCLSPLTREERRREGKSREERKGNVLCVTTNQRGKSGKEKTGVYMDGSWMGHG